MKKRNTGSAGTARHKAARQKAARMLAAVLLAAMVMAAGSAWAELRWQMLETDTYDRDRGTWQYVDTETERRVNMGAFSEIEIPDTVNSLNIKDFSGIGREFVIKCSPGSYAELFAKRNGLQYDTGEKRVVGYQIMNTNEKAQWVVDNYTDSSMNDVEKAKALHDWLTHNAHYDYTYTYYYEDGVLTKGIGVCNSYATAYVMLMQKAGVPVQYYVAWEMDHAWNLVKIGDTWYHVDATWDDSGDSDYLSGGEDYAHFLVTDDSLATNHTWTTAIGNKSGFVKDLDSDNIRYYLPDGTMLRGVNQITKLEFQLKNAVDTGSMKAQTYMYNFGEDGAMLKNSWGSLDGNTYFFGEDGKAVTGSWTIDDARYRFDSKGRMKTGFVTHDGKKHYYNEQGQEQTGWVTADGKTYYLGWDGPRTGLVTIGEARYVFDEDGVMQTGLVEADGRLYYAGEDGQLKTGWQTIDGKTYYFNTNAYTGRIYVSDGFGYGTRYVFDEDGVMQTGLVRYNDTLYLLKEDGTAEDDGWHTVDGKTYYCHNGKILTGTAGIRGGDGVYYSYGFASDGAMLTGLQEINGRRYYFEEDGKAYSGWKDINGERYYLYSDGTIYDGRNYLYDFDIGRYTYITLEDGKLPEAQAEDTGHTHVWVTVEGREASCNQTGLTEGRQCALCGEVLVAQEELPEEHGEIVYDRGKSATSTQTGLTEGQHCGICGKVLVEQKVIPMTDATARFVERCYETILQRAADQEGLKDWTSRLQKGKDSGADIVAGLLGSAEYLSQQKNHAETVEVLYGTMLGRAPQNGEENGWVGFLDQGCSEKAIINGFAGSDEFARLCDEYGIDGGEIETEERDRNIGVTGFVNRCYNEALLREGEAGGLNGWCGLLLSGAMTPKEVARGFVFSAELANRNLNHGELVAVMYRLYMGREPQGGEESGWVGLMDGGMSLEALNDGFADSAEFAEIVAGYGL